MDVQEQQEAQVILVLLVHLDQGETLDPQDQLEQQVLKDLQETALALLMVSNFTKFIVNT